MPPLRGQSRADYQGCGPEGGVTGHPTDHYLWLGVLVSDHAPQKRHQAD
jgi:hypothetical protein